MKARYEQRKAPSSSGVRLDGLQQVVLFLYLLGNWRQVLHLWVDRVPMVPRNLLRFLRSNLGRLWVSVQFKGNLLGFLEYLQEMYTVICITHYTNLKSNSRRLGGRSVNVGRL